MTKKHFIALADAIKQHNANEADGFTESQLDTLANFCLSQNPNFNVNKWISYIESGGIGQTAVLNSETP